MQHRCEHPKGSPLGVPPIAPKMSGLRQDVYFHEGIARTVEWYFAHEPWIARIEAGTYRQERLGTAQ